MDVASRADLKSDLLKELERHRPAAGYRGNPALPRPRSTASSPASTAPFAGLNQLQGKAGQALAGNDWLMSIRSRINIPGGTCEFDLPAYYAWQQHARAPPRRPAAGMATLTPLAEALQCCWACCATAARRNAWWPAGGQYQQSLPQARPTTCCACASTAATAWCPRSAATG
jgi:cell division protein ZapD